MAPNACHATRLIYLSYNTKAFEEWLKHPSNARNNTATT